jgi:vacuolar-type H+-ATPase subunit I/STV1
MNQLRSFAIIAIAAGAAACKMSHEDVRADSVQTAEQTKLTNQLAAQKDSLMTVVLDADKFISQIDSQISRVRDLPAPKRKKDSESPIQDQLQARKALLTRVDALVKRAQTTARELAAANSHVKRLSADSLQYAQSFDNDQKMLADLNSTIQRQTARLNTMQVQVDSLAGANAKLGTELALLQTTHNKVYYVIGNEEDLLKKGIVVREGGANLLLAHPGRTLQPARTLDASLFTAIDQREVHEIAVPDSTRNYAIVSRQSLDDADVTMRDRASFRGNLKIKDSDHFWSQSKYLIILER